MISENINNSMDNKFETADSGKEAGLMPKEKEALLKKEIKETHKELKALTEQFNILFEEDYFKSRQELESVLDKIRDIKTTQQIMSDKLEDILRLKDDLSVENLQKELDDNVALKN